MKKLFIYAVAAIALAACSTDKAGDNPSTTGNGQFNGEKAWVSLRLNPGNLGRSLNTTPTDGGTLTESSVKKVRVIFFNGTTASSTVVYDKTFVVGINGEIGTPGASGTKGDAFEVPGTTKSALIIANPIAGLKDEFDPDNAGTTSFTYAQFNTVRTDAVSALTDAANGFLMTNSRGTLEPVQIYKTKSEAENQPNAIYIDRVVSKVRVKSVPASTSTANVTLSDIKWLLNVTNKMYYPVSERTKTAINTPTPTDLIYSLGSYRKDPNYTAQNVTTFPDVKAAPYTDNYFAYYANSYPVPTDAAWKAPGSTDASWQYCLENTQTADGNNYAYTTQAVVRAKYQPDLVYIPGGSTEANPDSDGDWLQITFADANTLQHTFFSQQSLGKWILEELTNKYTDENPDSYPTKITDAYNGFLAGLQAANVSGVTKVTIPARDKVTYADPAAQATVVAKMFTDQNTAVKTNGAAMVDNVSFYKGGYSYYLAMIKHDNNNIKDNLLGEFGVVRNSQYEITVGSIVAPGYPVIPDPNPEVPNESENGWIDIQINVNPWTWYTQIEEW